METWSRPDGLKAWSNCAFSLIQEVFLDRCVLTMRLRRQGPHTCSQNKRLRDCGPYKGSHIGSAGTMMLNQWTSSLNQANRVESPTSEARPFIELDHGSGEAELRVKPIPQAEIGAVQLTSSGISC